VVECRFANVRNRLNNLTLDNLSSLVNGKKTVIIDEIQRVKDAGLLLKIFADNFKNIQFIATGSSALEISDTVFEPLTGRHFLFRLYPFSMMELYDGLNDFELESKLSFHLLYGLYPEVSTKPELSERILKNLASQYLYKDVLVWKNIRKPELLEKLLQLLAYQVEWKFPYMNYPNN
jgi:predicted AAA+ superfamily ATPase